MQQKIRKLVKEVRGSEFLRHNAVFFFGSVAVGALNYLYYPVLGRLLVPGAFGEVQTLVALFLQIIIFLNVLGLISVNIIANHGDDSKAQKTILELEKLALVISIVILLAVVALGPVLQGFFRFDSVAPFAVLALALVVTVPVTFRTAYLRGKQHFGEVSVSNFIGAAAKLALSVLFVVVGWGTVGAIAGLVIAQLASFAYSAARAKQAGFGPNLRTGFFRLPDMRLIAPELKYALLVLAGSLTITALYSIDIIAVKHYFDAHTAGLYAGVATVARIIFFLTGSISQVLLPAIKLNNPAAENKRVLIRSTYLLSALGGVTLILFWLMPSTIMGLLMGGEYKELAWLLPKLSLVVFIVSLLNLFVLYHMALRRYSLAIVVIMGLVVTCGLVVMNHDSPQAIVDSMLYGTLAMSGLLVGWSVWRARVFKGLTREQL